MTELPTTKDHWTLLIDTPGAVIEIGLYPTYDAGVVMGDQLMSEDASIERYILVPPTYGETIADA